MVLVVVLATIGAWILISLALGLGLPRLEDGRLRSLLGGTALAAGSVWSSPPVCCCSRRFRGWALLILVPGILALLVGVYGLSIALAAVNPPHPLSSGAPAGAERVVMTTADGVRLSGWYYPSQNGAALCFGMARTRRQRTRPPRPRPSTRPGTASSPPMREGTATVAGREWNSAGSVTPIPARPSTT